VLDVRTESGISVFAASFPRMTQGCQRVGGCLQPRLQDLRGAAGGWDPTSPLTCGHGTALPESLSQDNDSAGGGRVAERLIGSR
jgi:hypothetical protein